MNAETNHSCITRRQLISNVHEYFGEDIVQMHMNECASLICFREQLPDYLHLVKLVKDDHDDSALLHLHTEIVRECKYIHQIHHYNLGQFRRSKTIESTSPTLLKQI